MRVWPIKGSSLHVCFAHGVGNKCLMLSSLCPTCCNAPAAQVLATYDFHAALSKAASQVGGAEQQLGKGTGSGIVHFLFGT